MSEQQWDLLTYMTLATSDVRKIYLITKIKQELMSRSSRGWRKPEIFCSFFFIELSLMLSTVSAPSKHLLKE